MKKVVAFTVLCLAASSFGCMQTRHVEQSQTMTCDAGGCGSSVAQGATYSERCWQGFWPCQPARVQP